MQALRREAPNSDYKNISLVYTEGLTDRHPSVEMVGDEDDGSDVTFESSDEEEDDATS